MTNPLCGPSGCSAVYGPQKGADPETVRKMDDWLGRFAALTAETIPSADAKAPGAGAAGGLGFAFASFLGASLEPGISIVLRETGLEEKIRTADLVITGEGRLDGQTAMGKTPVGVARLAKKYGKPVIALGGSVLPEARACHGKESTPCSPSCPVRPHWRKPWNPAGQRKICRRRGAGIPAVETGPVIMSGMANG